jgi:hypothetical protein
MCAAFAIFWQPGLSTRPVGSRRSEALDLPPGCVSDRVDSVVNLADIPLKHRVVFGIHPQIGRHFYIFEESQTEMLAERNRFYFHVENGGRYPDETGSVFSTPEDATAHAVVVARELAQDGSWHGSSILVTDDRGQEIIRVRIGRHFTDK